MIENLKPYPAYKDSGEEWLEEVPTHWDVQSLGQIGRLSKGSGGTKEDEVTSGLPCIRYGDLYTTHLYFIRGTRSYISAKRASDYTPIQFGDVLFASSGETIEEIGKSAVNLIEEEAYCGGDVILFHPGQVLNPRYMGYATDSQPAAIQKAKMGRGITINHIYGNHLRKLILPLPPLPEQIAIARFLDHADSRIQRYIAFKEKLISLLKEYKQGIIQQAVTGQIDVRIGQPYPTYKDSGVEWLGKVPEHWRVQRLKTTSDGCISGIWGRNPEGENDLVCVRVADFDRVRLCVRLESPTLRTIELAERRGRLLQKGDLLLEKSGGGERQPVGAVVLYQHDIVAVCSNFVARMPVSPMFCPRYLVYLHSHLYTQRVNTRSIKQTTGIQNLDCLLYFNERIVVPFPPEQTAIATYLDKITADIDSAIQCTKRQIQLLREYRTRLIADVVTGKLDVGNAAEGLPEVDPVKSLNNPDKALYNNSEPSVYDEAMGY